LRKGQISDLLDCFETIDAVGTDEEASSATAVLLEVDGAAIVQMLLPRTARTFEQYSENIFIPFIKSKLNGNKTVHLVWDKYQNNSLKQFERDRRERGVGKSQAYNVTAKTRIPKSWQAFLRVSENKEQLFRFLSEQVLAACKDNEVYVTMDDKVLSTTPLDFQSLTPCTHEEADSRLILHLSHASNHGHESVIIKTVDTDVVVLGLSNFHQTGVEKLFIEFGVGKHLRQIAIHHIAAKLGKDKGMALPFFHALTGCDTTSSFAYHGKKSAWDTWLAMPGMT
jgi:hypothetical protein